MQNSAGHVIDSIGLVFLDFNILLLVDVNKEVVCRPNQTSWIATLCLVPAMFSIFLRSGLRRPPVIQYCSSQSRYMRGKQLSTSIPVRNRDCCSWTPTFGQFNGDLLLLRWHFYLILTRLKFWQFRITCCSRRISRSQFYWLVQVCRRILI